MFVVFYASGWSSFFASARTFRDNIKMLRCSHFFQKNVHPFWFMVIVLSAMCLWFVVNQDRVLCRLHLNLKIRSLMFSSIWGPFEFVGNHAFIVRTMCFRIIFARDFSIRKYKSLDEPKSRCRLNCKTSNGSGKYSSANIHKFTHCVHRVR